MSEDSLLDYKGLKRFKNRNDETYLQKVDLQDVTQLDEDTSLNTSDLLIKGEPTTGQLFKMTVASFLDGIKTRLLGGTDISSVGDGTVTGAINFLSEDTLAKNESGSSVTATVNTGGYLTSSNTNVLFMIPITNKDRTIDSITTNNTQIRQNGYLTGSSDGTAAFPSDASTTFSQTALGTRVTWVFASSIGGTNNDAVGVCGSITVNFKS